MLVSRLAMRMSHPAMALALVFIAAFVMLSGLSMMMSGRLMIECRITVMRSKAAFASYFGHVFAILTDRFAAFASSFRGFLGIEFMSVTAFMCGPASFASNLSLLIFIHGREAAILSLSHRTSP